MSDDLNTFRLVWFSISLLGFVASAWSMLVAAVDLLHVRREGGRWDFEPRYLRARQSFVDEVVFFFVQLCVLVVRIGAVIGPEPHSPAFRAFWAKDGSIIAVANLVVGLSRAWSLYMRRRTNKFRRSHEPLGRIINPET